MRYLTREDEGILRFLFGKGVDDDVSEEEPSGKSGGKVTGGDVNFDDSSKCGECRGISLFLMGMFVRLLQLLVPFLIF